METFSALLALCEGNPSVTVGFPSQRQETRRFDIFFDRLSKQSRRRWFETPSRPLWRYCPAMFHKYSGYDMIWTSSLFCLQYLCDKTSRERLTNTASQNLANTVLSNVLLSGAITQSNVDLSSMVCCGNLNRFTKVTNHRNLLLQLFQQFLCKLVIMSIICCGDHSR